VLDIDVIRRNRSHAYGARGFGDVAADFHVASR
jgi:hypothetical protein